MNLETQLPICKTPEDPTVYLDHNATTPLSQNVAEKVQDWLVQWGNPSSIHKSGRGPKKILRESRQALAKSLGCSPLELIFTSGGSEANNLAIKGVFEAVELNLNLLDQKELKNEYITSSLEHPSVRKTFEYLQAKGKTVHFIPANRRGELDLGFYKQVLSEKTALVSVMYANNETGNLFPIKELCDMAHQKGALFHTDAVQALGKAPIQLKEWGVDLASFSAHKFYALKGCGLLYSRSGLRIHSLIHGGGQERGRRAGTENTLAIGSLGLMSELLPRTTIAMERVRQLTELLESQVQKQISKVHIIGSERPRLANTSCLYIEGIDGETLLMNLDLKGFCVSTGAACSSGNPEPSPVLLAMGYTAAEAQSTLRVSLGWSTTEKNVKSFVEQLVKTVEKIRQIKSEVSK